MIQLKLGSTRILFQFSFFDKGQAHINSLNLAHSNKTHVVAITGTNYETAKSSLQESSSG